MKKIELTEEYLHSLGKTIEESNSKGEKYYFDKTKCLRGHISPKSVKDNKCFLCKRDDAKISAEKRRLKLGITPKNKVTSLKKGLKYLNLTATGNLKTEMSVNRKKNRTLHFHEVICICSDKFWIASYNWGISQQCSKCVLNNMQSSNITHNLSYKIEFRLFSSAKKRAKESKIEFNLEIEDIKIPENCPILGLKLDVSINNSSNRAPRNNAPSIDRIDSSKGYIKGNIAIISYKANVLKKDGTSLEHIKVAEFMEKWGL